jgi:hypothetical protein
MKKKTLLALAGAALLLSACIPSVNPFYTERDVTFDPRLVGTWSESSGNEEYWRFEDGGDGKYKFTVAENKKKHGEFEARLFKLKDNLFLDITPSQVELREDQAEMTAMALIPGHLLIRVRQVEPTLKADFFDWDWLGEYLKENPKALAHRGGGQKEGIVLTAETRELQRFVLRHLKDGELFKVEKSNAGLMRVTNPPPATATPAK